MTYYVSIIVGKDTEVIDSVILRTTIPLDRNKAFEYLSRLDEWLEQMPDPDMPTQEPLDKVSVQAADLSRIIRKRDARLFPDEDAEAIDSEHSGRPYDYLRLANAHP